MSIKKDAAFDAFSNQAQGMLGSDLSEDWLFEIWQGADADLNRALNHVLDTPEDKIKRNGGGKQSSSQPKTPKKSKAPRESKPAPPTPATTWGDDDYTPPMSPLPAPVHHAPPVHSQQAPLPPPQQAAPMPYGYPPMTAPGQPVYPMYPSAPYGMPMMSGPGQMPGMMSAPASGGPQFLMDPLTGLPMAPVTPAQQAQTMFVHQQQHQRLMQLKLAVDSVLANPASFSNPQIMQNLQDTMLQALEAPNATLQMAERARQSQQTSHFIQLMQNQIGQMLSDPKVATNPQMLQQLNNQMNQLRMLTMQHVAQQQIDANPATALSLSVPILTNPSASMLSRALQQATAAAVGGQASPRRAEREDWWLEDSAVKVSEKNPFKEEMVSSPRNNPSSMQNLNQLSSLQNLNQLSSMQNLNQPFLGIPAAQHAPNPLGQLYSQQQLGGAPAMYYSSSRLQ